MKFWFILLLAILSCIGACAPKSALVTNQQLILIVPEQLLQQPEQLQELIE